MDFKTLSLVIAMRATDRGATAFDAAALAAKITDRLMRAGNFDLSSGLWIIEDEFAMAGLTR